MAAAEKSMAERHRDEIAAIIAGHEDGLKPHKGLAFWKAPADNPRAKPPLGWNTRTVAAAHRTIAKARAQCSADIRAACERQREEANALAAKPAIAATAAADTDKDAAAPK